jgi:hypothetical protein
MVRQYRVSWVSSDVVGVAVVLGVDFGACGVPNLAQNSVALRPDASIARRHASDAAVPPVALSFAAMYFAKQSFTSASMFVVGLEGFVEGDVEGFTGAVLGCAFGANRVQNSVDVRPETSIARRQASEAAVPAVPAVVLVFRAVYLVRQSV